MCVYLSDHEYIYYNRIWRSCVLLSQGGDKCVCVCDRACMVCVCIQMIIIILIIKESDTVVFFSRRVEIKSCVCVW